jgi:DNA mismatch repair protein MutS
LAGLPATVIDRAKQVMTQIEKHSRIAVGLRHSKQKAKEKNETYPIKGDRESEQLDMFNE